MILWADGLLGLRRMWGIRYFDKSFQNKIEKRGIYKFMKNPIYTGIVLYFIGKSFTSNSLYYLFVALESYLLMNVFLARFENKEIK